MSKGNGVGIHNHKNRNRNYTNEFSYFESVHEKKKKVNTSESRLPPLRKKTGWIHIGQTIHSKKD